MTCSPSAQMSGRPNYNLKKSQFTNTRAFSAQLGGCCRLVPRSHCQNRLDDEPEGNAWSSSGFRCNLALPPVGCLSVFSSFVRHALFLALTLLHCLNAYTANKPAIQLSDSGPPVSQPAIKLSYSTSRPTSHASNEIR
jgi:hypothetical protein